MLDLVAEAALWLVVWGCPLALGGAASFCLWPLVALSALSLGSAWLGLGRRQPLSIPAPFWVLAAAAAFCLLQLLPLPGPLLGVVSPPGAELRDFALLPLGLSGVRPVSLDPPSTWRELAKHLAYAFLLLSAAQLARSRSTRRRLLSAVASSGVAVALLGFGHRLAGAHRLFGAYAFTQAQPPLLTPFGNPNHLAAFLTLSSSVCIGLASTAKRRESTFLWAGGGVATGVAVLLSLSRAGIFFFLFAQLAIAGLALLSRAPAARRTRWKRGAVVFAVLGSVVAASGYLALDPLLAELSTANTLEKVRASKLELWGPFAQAALRFWPAGMGRGAFEVGYGQFQQLLPGTTFSHPENWVLQLASEFGLFGACTLLALSGWALLRLFRRRYGSALGPAALCGLLAVFLHDLFDFSLELPATASATCVVLGCLCALSDPAEAENAVLVWPRAAVPAFAAATALALLALVLGRETLDAANARLRRVAASGSAPQVRAAALPLIDRHPAHYLLYEQVADAYARPAEDPRQALAFVNRALFLRPIDSTAHRTAARALLAVGRRLQAMGEYQLAAKGSEGGPALEEGIGSAHGLDELTQLVGIGPARVLEVAQRLEGLNRVPEAEALVEWGTQWAGGTEAMHLWSELAHLRSAAQHYPEALAALDEAERLGPDAPETALSRADVLWAMDRRGEALSSLAALAAHHPHWEVSFALAQKLLNAGDGLRALEVLEHATPSIPANQREPLLVMKANAYELLHRPAKAAEYFQTAARLDPASPNLRYALARALEAMGRPREAIAALREGMAIDTPAGAQAAEQTAARLSQQVGQLESQSINRAESQPDAGEEDER